MNLEVLISEAVYCFLGESNKDKNDIKDIMIKRVPFLKGYNIYEHGRDPFRLEAQKTLSNENVSFIIDGDIVVFPYFNLSSEVTYYSHEVYDNKFHHFIINNKLHVKKPEDMGYLEYRILLLTIKSMGEALSYHKELKVKSGNQIDVNVLDGIVNDMNRTLFKVEEFCEKYSLKTL